MFTFISFLIRAHISYFPCLSTLWKKTRFVNWRIEFSLQKTSTYRVWTCFRLFTAREFLICGSLICAKHSWTGRFGICLSRLKLLVLLSLSFYLNSNQNCATCVWKRAGWSLACCPWNLCISLRYFHQSTFKGGSSGPDCVPAIIMIYAW